MYAIRSYYGVKDMAGLISPADDEEADGPKNIVFYDPETLESKTLVTAAQLTP